MKNRDEEQRPLLLRSRTSLESKPRALQPSNIRLVRHRMLYAKASLNGRGTATFGLRHIRKPHYAIPCEVSVLKIIDVLNRFPNHTKRDHTVHIMKYIFPRQFELHNVFTSRTDSKETTQPFKDYTLREEEIEQKDHTRDISGLSTTHLPKRLRGVCFALIQRLQRLHDRCSYSQLLAHHCPSSVSQVMLLAATLLTSCSLCHPQTLVQRTRTLPTWQASTSTCLPLLVLSFVKCGQWRCLGQERMASTTGVCSCAA